MTPGHTLLAALASRARLDEIQAWIEAGLLCPGVAKDGEEDLSCFLRHVPRELQNLTHEGWLTQSAVALLKAGAQPFALKGPGNALGWALEHDMGTLVEQLLQHPEAPSPSQVIHQHLPHAAATGHLVTDLQAHRLARSLKAVLDVGCPLPPRVLDGAYPETLPLLLKAGATVTETTLSAWADRLQQRALKAREWQTMMDTVAVESACASAQALGSMLGAPTDAMALQAQLKGLTPASLIPVRSWNDEPTPAAPLWAISLASVRLNPKTAPRALLMEALRTTGWWGDQPGQGLLALPPETKWRDGVTARGWAWLLAQHENSVFSPDAVEAWSAVPIAQLWNEAEHAYQVCLGSKLIQAKHPLGYITDVWSRQFMKDMTTPSSPRTAHLLNRLFETRDVPSALASTQMWIRLWRDCDASAAHFKTWCHALSDRDRWKVLATALVSAALQPSRMTLHWSSALSETMSELLHAPLSSVEAQEVQAFVETLSEKSPALSGRALSEGLVPLLRASQRHQTLNITSSPSLRLRPRP